MKKTTKGLLLAVIIICIALCAIFSMAAAAEDTTITGASFSQTEYFDQERNMSPTGNITAEAEIWLDPNGTYVNTPAIIFGNYKDNNTKGLDFLIRDGKYVELYRRISSGATQLRFSTNVRELCTGTSDEPGFVKISVSVNTADGAAILYVNGEKEESKTSVWKDENAFAALENPFRIGGDLRSTASNTKYFDGQIKNVALYNDVRTAEEVAADAAKSNFSVDKTDANLLFAYDLTDTSVKGMLKDLSKYKNNAKNPNTYVEPTADNGFSFTAAMGYDMKKAITPNGSMTFEAFTTLPTDNNRCG